jgi:hypothetical protein
LRLAPMELLSANQSARESMTSSLTKCHPPLFLCPCTATSLPFDIQMQKTMAANLRPVSRLAARPLSAAVAVRQAQIQSPFLRATATSQFHTSSRRCATPSGPPPKGFRLPTPKRFDEGEGAMDKASNYFLLTEMFRGMYVVLEQFFRPP